MIQSVDPSLTRSSKECDTLVVVAVHNRSSCCASTQTSVVGVPIGGSQHYI
jgi:hypothetical protein